MPLIVLLAGLLAGTPNAPDVIGEELFDRAAIEETGVGSLVVTGTLTAGALGLTLARIGVLARNCPLHADDAAARCSYEGETDILLMVPRLALNVAAVALAPGTGAMMGRHAAWRAAMAGGPSRSPRRIAGIGGGLLAAGIVGIGTSAALSIALSRRCVAVQSTNDDDLAGERCIMRALPVWTMLNFSSFAASGAGLGLLGYASGYRHTRARIDGVFALAGPDRVGMGFSGSF